MADQINLAFPDQSYSESNKPSAVTLKDDLQALEDAHNANALDINDHESRLSLAEADVIDLRGGQEGLLINGKIVTSVASNNLTVAIKTLAGVDPSVADPVYVRINNTIRTVTYALSLTLNAGTNWFASGSDSSSNVGGLSGFEVDYFLYAFWNTNTSTVTLGMGRIPFALTYGGFNATNTHQAYCGLSSTAPASSDACRVLGRFNATLSATPFNWSIPATSVIVNNPIFQTRLLSFAPGFSNGSNAPGNAVRNGKYVINGQTLDQIADFVWGSTTVFNATFRIYGMWLYDTTTYPFACSVGDVYMLDAGNLQYGGYGVDIVGGAGYAELRSGSTVVNSTTPFTWVSGDKLALQWRVLINAT